VTARRLLVPASVETNPRMVISEFGFTNARQIRPVFAAGPALEYCVIPAQKLWLADICVLSRRSTSGSARARTSPATALPRSRSAVARIAHQPRRLPISAA
jgi:hypothetical protein